MGESGPVLGPFLGSVVPCEAMWYSVGECDPVWGRVAPFLAPFRGAWYRVGQCGIPRGEFGTVWSSVSLYVGLWHRTYWCGLV